MLKERDMNHNTNTQRTANSDGAPVKMGRVVNFIDVDDLDSDETGNYGPMPPAVGMSKSKVSRVNAPRAQSHASAANSARTIKQDSKQNSLSKTMNAKPCASAASLNANSSVSNKKSSSPGPVVPAIGSTTMQKRVISNIEGIPKKALAGPNAQLDSPPPATIPLTETQFDPKSSDKAINYLKRPRRKSSGAGNTVVSTEEQLGGNSTSEDRKTVLHAVESGTQSQVQKRSQISPSNYAPSQAQISSLVGTAKGSLNIRVGPDGVVNMSTDDEDNSPPPKAVKLSPPPAREKPQSQHSIQRPNRNRVKRKIENVAHTETVPRKSTHVNSDDRPMAMNTNTNTNTNTNATTYTNATKLDTSTGTIKTANTKPSTTSRKTTDGKSATTRRRVVPYLLESGSDTLSKRGVRITSRSSYRTTEQLDSSSEDDDDSDGTPGPPAALVWGKRDKLYKPAGISQKQKGGMSNSGLISRNGTKTKAESIVCSIANGADMKPWDRSTSATGIVHVKRPKYLDCQSEQIGAWRKKKTSKTKHNLSFDKTGNVKGYSSIMRSQMDIAIRAAELSRHTEYKETDREKLGVDDLTGDDVILDILENAVLILDDNGDENESIYGYFVDEPCPASSTQRSRARNSDESRVPMELPTKPPVVERGVANNKAIVNTTDEHSMQGPSRVNENTLSKRPESALSQAQAFSLPARVTRRSGSVYAGEKKGRTSEEMFQQIASRNESRPWNSIAKGRRMTNEGNMVDAAEEQRLKEQSKKFYREQLQLERDVFGFDHTPYTPDFVPAESPEPEEEVEHNNHCSTCSFGGMLVMCEDCPKSFHLLCAEPPLHRVPKEDWLCCTCKHAKALEDQTENKLTRKDYTGLDSATPWDMLIVSGTRKNPISMELPYTINEDVKYEPYAPWLPPSQLPIQRTVEKEESVSKNKCTMCYRGSAIAPVLPCSSLECPQGFHADCLTPPLTVSIREKGWKCPAHVDHPLGQLRRAGRLPLKPKNTWKSDIDIVEEFMDNAADHWKSRYENLRRKEVTVVDELAQLHLASVPTYEKRSILQLGLQQYMVDTTKEETSTDTLMIEFMEFCEATKSTHRVQRYLDIYNDSTVHQLATTECADTSETEVAEAAAEVS